MEHEWPRFVADAAVAAVAADIVLSERSACAWAAGGDEQEAAAAAARWAAGQGHPSHRPPRKTQHLISSEKFSALN